MDLRIHFENKNQNFFDCLILNNTQLKEKSSYPKVICILFSFFRDIL
jgi:hypothetical protein